MKISLNWLKDWTEFTEKDPQSLADQLTDSSAEVEELLGIEHGFEKVVTGKLLKWEKIKGSDKLHEGTFDLGRYGTKTIIFGSVFPLNTDEIYPIAMANAILPTGIHIESKKVLGVQSEGMVCSDEELGISYTKEGLLRFPKSAPLGIPVISLLKATLQNVFIGEILDIQKHPNADKLSVTKVKISENEALDIVCGGSNLALHAKVPVAVVGSNLFGFTMKKAKIRDIESNGMICSTEELSLSPSQNKEIYILPEEAPLGTSLFEYIFNEDTILDIENTTITNRPDLFSQMGFAREFCALGLAHWKEKDMLPNLKEESQESFPFRFQVQNSEIAPRVCGVIVKNFKVEPSPEWMQKRLQACGVRSINNLVDITNYVMLEMGMPLHAFDLESIDGNVVMRTSQEGEKVVTLDGETRTLPEGVILMEDEKKIFDLCGIMGGENSGVKDSTQTVWIHAPVYDAVRIRRASIALNHRTDASVIYEKRVPSGIAPYGLQRAIDLMLELCPEAEVASEKLDINNDPESARILILSKEKLQRVFGEKLEESFVEKVLKDLGFEVETHTDSYKVNVPFFRFKDIAIEEDLIEEVIRIYGLESIQDELPSMTMEIAQPAQGYMIEKKIKTILAESAYEVLNFSFLGKKLLEKTGFQNFEKLIEVANPLSEDIALMRPSLLPYVLEKAMQNQHGEDSFNLFELGKVFEKVEGKNGVTSEEKKNLLFLGFNKTFFETKAILEKLFSHLGLQIQIRNSEKGSIYAHPGQVAEIFFQGKFIGFLNTLHPRIAKNFDITKPVSFFEIYIDTILSSNLKAVQYKEINKLPAVERDQNFIVDKKVLSTDFLRKIQKGIPLLEYLSILDIYEGEHIEAGKKCITVQAIYQAPDRTLTDEEVEASHKKLIEMGEKNGAKLR